MQLVLALNNDNLHVENKQTAHVYTQRITATRWFDDDIPCAPHMTIS